MGGGGGAFSACIMLLSITRKAAFFRGTSGRVHDFSPAPVAESLRSLGRKKLQSASSIANTGPERVT